MDSDSSRKAAVSPSSPLDRGWKRPVISGRDARGRALTMIGADRPHLHPGPVRINVQGAFIVEDEEQDIVAAASDYHHHHHHHHHRHPSPQAHSTKDIRLPNHTAAVSHVAVDVS
jgi:type II pantothenate kinase